MGAAEGKVYPVQIFRAGRIYLALYYYTETSDALLCDGQNILFFETERDMRDYCQSHLLLIEGETAIYDFDASIQNPIDYSHVLNRWNLLDTISETLSMYFEGKRREYDRLYDLLFRCSTCKESIAPKVYLNRKELLKLNRVFKRCGRYFKRFRAH